MARSALTAFVRRALPGLAVVSFGLTLTGPAWSAASERAEKAPEKPERVWAEVSHMEVAPGAIDMLAPGGVVQGTPIPSFIDEVEPNDTTAAPQALATTPVRVRGNLFRVPFSLGIDEDVYSFTAAPGDRVYAASMTNFSSADTDTLIDIVDVDGTTVLETDDDDGALTSLGSAVGGTVLTTGGTYYVRVRAFNPTGLVDTVRPYDIYVNVLSGAPTPEVEPNNAVPNPVPANGWVSGTVDPAAEFDLFSVAANAGDTVVAILDADPERDAPEWDPRLGMGVFNGFILIFNSSGADATKAEAVFFTVPTAGTYLVYVDAAAGGGPGFTYNLSVFVIPAKTRTCTSYAGTGGAITSPGATDFTIPIPDVRTIDYLRVGLNATHPLTADLDVSLISPDGNEVVLFDDIAASAVPPQPLIDLTIEDEASFAMGGSSFLSGNHQAPEGGTSSARLEYFRGMQALGTWTLRVRDDVLANAGTLNSWRLDVCEAEPRPACVIPGPGETTVFATDFEAGDAGFTHAGVQDEWELGTPSFAPITTAHSGVNAFKTDLDNTYNASGNFDLLSPPIDLTAVPPTGRVTLNWWQKFQMESTTFDFYWAEVREVANPANARRLFSWTGATMTRTVGSPTVTIQESAGWGLVQADISDFRGLVVEVRFHLETDTVVQLGGVAIDDVSVTSCTAVVGTPIGDAAITKTDNQTTYFPGQVLTYIIEASNNGPDPVIGATVTDTFPAELTNVSWTCSAPPPSACGSPSGNGDINTTVDLVPGGIATFTVTATVSMSATGDLTNTATIVVPVTTFDPDTANNSASDTDTFVPLTAAPAGLTVDDGGNDVYEPNETVIVAPSWSNTGPGAVPLAGTLANHTGPAGPAYTIPDADANYGTIPVASSASCLSTGDCYSVSNSTSSRPATHWDSTADETVSTGDSKTWTLHIGESFTDVPASSGFYRFVETILHNGVTVGCTTTEYCPIASTTREAMAAFVLVANDPGGTPPPNCVAGAEEFDDVPASSGFCRWIEELFRRGVVTGCGTRLYCPTSPATREQMAVFVLRTLDPTLTPPACVAGSERFDDVPASSGFCPWIEELERRGVVTGCTATSYCPTADVTREQMSVFLAVTFGLVLYGL